MADATQTLDPRRDASALRTKKVVFGVFASASSVRVLGLFLVLAVVGRLIVAHSPGLSDVVALVVTIAATGSVEWFIHRHLLHAPEGSVRMRLLGTGRGHREHHRRPTDVGWIMLSPSDVVAFAVGFVPFNENEGIISWYSSHEKDSNDKPITAIYVANLKKTQGAAEIDPLGF